MGSPKKRAGTCTKSVPWGPNAMSVGPDFQDPKLSTIVPVSGSQTRISAMSFSMLVDA